MITRPCRKVLERAGIETGSSRGRSGSVSESPALAAFFLGSVRRLRGLVVV